MPGKGHSSPKVVLASDYAGTSTKRKNQGTSAGLGVSRRSLAEMQPCSNKLHVAAANMHSGRKSPSMGRKVKDVAAEHRHEGATTALKAFLGNKGKVDHTRSCTQLLEDYYSYTYV